MENRNTSRVILTSIGFSNPKILKYLLSVAPPNQTKAVAVVVTASRGKSSHQFAQLAYQQLEESGYKNIKFLDFDTDTVSIKEFDLIYVCGGNTFHLNASMHKNGYAEELREHILGGCCYVGVSAGTCILGNNLYILDKIGMDPSSEEDKQHPPLALLPFDIVPHANILSEQQRAAINNETVLLLDHEALVFGYKEEKGLLELTQKITVSN